MSINPYSEKGHFYCISYFYNNLDLIKKLNKSNYIVYNKSSQKLPAEINNISIKNVGFNLYSYLEFIIKNYENLPKTIVFCKNNIVPRHLDKNTFEKLIQREVFTHLRQSHIKVKTPISIKLSNNSFNEINSNWYIYSFDRKYFADFNEFYEFIFKDVNKPHYLNFSPGGNYLVRRENILLRSKNFYKNLKLFISHTKLSGESHFLERSLDVIWNSDIESSEIMDKIIDKEKISYLIKKCQYKKSRELKFYVLIRKAKQKIIFKLGSIYFKILESIIYN
tara:strand:+ start:899 stop:1735 length:837 start_codon:yes stop_codon:yes gene_type:complete